MNFDTLKALDKLKQEIGDRSYEELTGTSYWREYEVMICERADDSAKRWARLPLTSQQVNEFQRTEPRRRIIATRYATSLVWLFKELEKIHASEDEFRTYQDFFADLADTANEYLDERKAGATATRLLEAVLDRVRKLYD